MTRVIPQKLTVAALLAIAGLGGCDLDKLWSWSDRGTVRAVDNCVLRNSTGSIHKETIRSICIQRHEQLLSETLVQGNAGYAKTGSRTYIDGVLTNTSENYVFTDILLHFVHNTAKGPNGSGFEPVHLTRLWIEPGSSESFTYENLQVLPPDGTESDFKWTVAVVRGLEIRVD